MSDHSESWPHDPEEDGDLREYDREDDPTPNPPMTHFRGELIGLRRENIKLQSEIIELRAEIAELKETSRNSIRHHYLLKQQFLGMQKQHNVNYQRLLRLLHITESAGDIDAMFKQILVEKKVASMPVKLSSEQLELISTRSFLEVTDQLATIKGAFMEQQEKFVALTNWVAAQFGKDSLPADLGVLTVQPKTTKKLQRELGVPYGADQALMRKLMAKA